MGPALAGSADLAAQCVAAAGEDNPITCPQVAVRNLPSELAALCSEGWSLD